MRPRFLQTKARLRHRSTLLPPQGMAKLLSVSVGPVGEAVALWTAEGVNAFDIDSDEISERVYELGGPVAVTVHGSRPAPVLHVPRFVGSEVVAQALPHGSILIAGKWAAWRPEGPEANAAIFASDAVVELSACIGDGIQGVLATPEGAIWVSYRDMGIFGNNGWGEPGVSPWPIGSPGLIRFSTALEPAWEFPGNSVTSRTQSIEPIDDCEAITLAGDALWVYYYTSYNVARIENDVVKVWSPSRPAAPAAFGVQALITDGDRVAMAGGYRGDEDRVVVGTLGQEEWTVDRATRLRLPGGESLPPHATMQGFGDTLNVFVAHEW